MAIFSTRVLSSKKSSKLERSGALPRPVNCFWKQGWGIGSCFQKHQQKHEWVCKGRGYLGLVAGMHYSPTLYGFVKLEMGGGVEDYCLVSYQDPAFMYRPVAVQMLLCHFGGQNYQWSEECAQLNSWTSWVLNVLRYRSSTRCTMTIGNFDHQNGG